MDHIHFPYRDSSHLALLHVVAESGAWEKYGVDVNYDYKIRSVDAHKEIPKSAIEFVGGNHVSTYGYRARGDNWVYLGQTVNFTNCRLVCRPDDGIERVSDLRNRIVGSYGSHPGLNDWLFLKQHGLDVDRDDYDFRQQIPDSRIDDNPGDRAVELYEQVRQGEIDAALLTPPKFDLARKAGLKVIDVEPLPMIWFTTISSSLAFVEKHPDLVDRFLKGMIEGVHFFKTERERTIDIIQRRHDSEGQLDRATATRLRDELAVMLEPKLYPSLAAITNVFEEAKRKDPDSARVNPLALWDMHHVRQLDDSGFIDQLYGGQPDPGRVPDALTNVVD